MNDVGYNIEAVNDGSLFLSVKKCIYLFIKRVFDIVLSLIGIIFLIPISIIIKIAYILDKDNNSIFYTQNRIGKDGKEFKLYKFRSMIVDADLELKKILKKNKKLAREYRINKKLKDDPRITKIGRVIRRFSIDELPQLINVLKGDMSFIGNRPYLPREKEDMGEYFDDIVKTKPGLTGYWQVSGRSDVTFAYRLELERYYSNCCGLKMDIKIFLKTFNAVFGCKGAK